MKRLTRRWGGWAAISIDEDEDEAQAAADEDQAQAQAAAAAHGAILPDSGMPLSMTRRRRRLLLRATFFHHPGTAAAISTCCCSWSIRASDLGPPLETAGGWHTAVHPAPHALRRRRRRRRRAVIMSAVGVIGVVKGDAAQAGVGGHEGPLVQEEGLQAAFA
jgi:hypothetical protein